MISHHSLIWHLPHGYQCWVSFMRLFAIYVTSLVNCPNLLLIFLLSLFLVAFSNWVLRILCIFYISLLLEIWFEFIFSQSLSCLYIFLLVSFDTSVFWSLECFILMKSNLSTFYFVFCVLVLSLLCVVTA